MKLIVIFLFVFTVLDVRGQIDDNSLPKTLSVKEQFRLDIKYHFTLTFDRDVDDLCTHYLSSEQTTFGNQKLNDFVKCGNATIDKFVDSLNFEIDESELQHINSSLSKFVGPLCQSFDNIFKCIRNVEPLIDLCISEYEQRTKQQLFANVPLIKETVCLRNGDLLANLLEFEDGFRCLEHIYNWMSDISLDAIFNDDNSVDLFGTERLCRGFSRLQIQTYEKLGECSTDVQNIASLMLNYFCNGTQCQRFITDLKCF